MNIRRLRRKTSNVTLKITRKTTSHILNVFPKKDEIEAMASNIV